MQRAGVFIGVNQTGQLATLNDAAANAGRMHKWAVGQGMVEGKSAILITDETGAVTPDRIADAVEQIINEVAPEQLIIYYAGHGVLARSAEQWLLTKAPVRSTAAVDVTQSVTDAKLGKVPHVVVISDACRTAPEGIQAQNVMGGSIFPNVLSGRQCKVDVYYACAVGKPSAEIQSEVESVGSYRGVFTEVLLDALTGDYRAALLRRPRGDKTYYVGVRRLEDVLGDEVPRKIRSKRLKARYTQNPWADVVSDDNVWISQLDALPRAPAKKTAAKKAPAKRTPSGRAAGRRAEAGAPRGLATSPGDEVFAENPYYVGNPYSEAAPPRAPRPAARPRARVEREVASAARALTTEFGPQAFETECGVKVRGARIVAYFAAGMHAEEAVPGEVLRLYPPQSPADRLLSSATIVLGFDNNRVTALPMIAGYIASLTFEDDELVSVSYEPSANSWRWPMYHKRLREIRGLRSRAAAASARGVFEFSNQADELAVQMQYAKGIDPSLAVYAAYGYHARGEFKRIQKMSWYLTRDVGTTFFDLELLGRGLIDRVVTKSDPVLPCTPLLTQGWSIMRAHRTKLPTSLKKLEQLATNSLWSVYQPDAFDLFRTGLTKGQLR